MELLSSLGIEWKLIIAQIVNFGILVFILYKLVYKPLLSALDSRVAQVKEVAEKTSSIDSKLEEIKSLEEKTLAEARKAGAKIIKDTEEAAVKLKAKLESEAVAEATKLIKEAEARIKADQDKQNANLKAEIKDLVATAIESTIGKYLNDDAKKKLADEASSEALKVERFLESHK